MIHGLVRAAATRLRTELAAVLPAGERVAEGPAPDPVAQALPRLVLSAGRMEAAPAPPETDEGVPRPRPARQRIDLAGGGGPYRLEHAPVPGTARGRLVLAEGTLAEAAEPLAEGPNRDFVIDPVQRTLALRIDLDARRTAHAQRIAAQVQARVGRPFDLDSPKELSEALFTDLGLAPQGERNESGYYSTERAVLDALADAHPVVPLVIAYGEIKDGGGVAVWVEYAFAGVFTRREFRQALLLDAWAATGAEAERWASLAAAVLLTGAPGLLAEATADYAAPGGVSALHKLTRLELAEGETAAFEGGIRQRLTFSVRGQLTCACPEPQTLAILRHVHSPAAFAPGVAVEPELG
ncbi:MAG TPA: DNA polymerase [Longimicrobium sp.]|nr:DNA polymerase [Longimicrobium sp.]